MKAVSKKSSVNMLLHMNTTRGAAEPPPLLEEISLVWSGLVWSKHSRSTIFFSWESFRLSVEDNGFDIFMVLTQRSKAPEHSRQLSRRLG